MVNFRAYSVRPSAENGQSDASRIASSRVGYIDALRCIAAVCVLLQHALETTPGWIGRVPAYTSPGVAGVALFFFVSGYVMPVATKRSFGLGPFIVRRLFRIYPLYLSLLLGIFLCGYSGFLDHWAYLPSAPARVWLANVLLIQDYVGAHPILGVSWTLSIEFFWYGLFAATMLASGSIARALRFLSWAAPAVLILSCVASLALNIRLPLGRMLMPYAAVVGASAYGVGDDGEQRKRFYINIGVFLCVATAANIVAFGIFSNAHITFWQSFCPWLGSTLIFSAIVAIPGLRTARWLNSGILPSIGAMSYSIYLCHPIAIALTDQHLHALPRLPTIVATTAIISMIGYFGVERAGIEIGRRVARTISWPRILADRATSHDN